MKQTKKLQNIIRACLFILPLAACSGAELGLIVGAGTVATIINEDKLPVDYIAEARTGLDCNSIRRLNDKGPLCREDQTTRYIDPVVYCYRTIGRVECYETKDPYKQNIQPIQ